MIETDGPSGNIRKTILLDNWIHFILCCRSLSPPTHFLERFLLRDIWKMGGNPLLLIPALEKWDGIKHNSYIFQKKAHWNKILNIIQCVHLHVSYFFHLFYMLQKFVPILSENSWKVIVSSSPILPFSLFPAQGKASSLNLNAKYEPKFWVKHSHPYFAWEEIWQWRRLMRGNQESVT